MPPISIPTSLALPPSQRIASSNPGILRALSKLSRPSLISLVLDWLDDRNQELSAPHLLSGDETEDEQDLYPPSQSLEELREIYGELQSRKGSKREVVDRIIEGDWRDGLSLYQLAMADMQYLYDHPNSQKWTALKVVKLADEDADQPSESAALPCMPRFHPPTFLQNLQREVLPDVKAHYNLDRHPLLPILLLRIYVIDSPFNTSLALSNNRTAALDSSKTIYIAFPDASPHVFVSLATSTPSSTGINSSQSNMSLRKLILDGIPKAFSKPRARYGLQSTNLAARNLDAMSVRRGAGRANAAGGGWGVYAEDNKENIKNDTPLNSQLPTPPGSEDQEINKIQDKPLPLGMKRKGDRVESESLAKRRRNIAEGRFGNVGKVGDKSGIERLDIRIEDSFPASKLPGAGELEFSDNDAAAEGEDIVHAAQKRRGRRKSMAAELQKGEDDDTQEGWIPDVRVTFHGTHIFAGIRKLVEAGVVDGVRMPGWMTGEDGVSIGVVREGRIKGFKGSAL